MGKLKKRYNLFVDFIGLCLLVSAAAYTWGLGAALAAAGAALMVLNVELEVTPPKDEPPKEEYV